MLRPAARIAAIGIAIVTLCGLAAGPARAAQTTGIQIHALWGDVSDAQMRHQLDLVKASGARVARVDVGWSSLQQDGPDGYSKWYLDKVDRLVEAADARGLDLLLTFMNTPCWASTAPASVKQGCRGEWWSSDRLVDRWAPADAHDYARALAFLVRRYGTKVAAWEIWNEPNNEEFMRAPDRALAYARLLRAAYPAVKAANPRAVVVGGALSECDHAFTQRLYDYGVKGFFDAYAVHPYSIGRSPLAGSPVDPRYSFIQGVPAVRRVMLRNGDRRPMWLTESGWSTATVRTADQWRNGVSEATQARWVRDEARQTARWPYVKVNVWYTMFDESRDRAELHGNMGLRRADDTPKPAWFAFRRATATLQRVSRARAARRARARAARHAKAGRRSHHRRRVRMYARYESR